MKDKIQQLLETHLKPLQLQIEDQSQLHSDHNRHAIKGGTHFRIVIVAETFRGLNRLARHRLIYDILKGPLSEGVHALALTTLAPDEVTA